MRAARPRTSQRAHLTMGLTSAQGGSGEYRVKVPHPCACGRPPPLIGPNERGMSDPFHSLSQGRGGEVLSAPRGDCHASVRRQQAPLLQRRLLLHGVEGMGKECAPQRRPVWPLRRAFAHRNTQRSPPRPIPQARRTGTPMAKASDSRTRASRETGRRYVLPSPRNLQYKRPTCLAAAPSRPYGIHLIRESPCAGEPEPELRSGGGGCGTLPKIRMPGGGRGNGAAHRPAPEPAAAPTGHLRPAAAVSTYGWDRPRRRTRGPLHCPLLQRARRPLRERERPAQSNAPTLSPTRVFVAHHQCIVTAAQAASPGPPAGQPGAPPRHPDPRRLQSPSPPPARPRAG